MQRQLELFGLQWAIRIRSMADSIWKHDYFGWSAIFGFSCWYLFWAFHIPSPSKAATLLAVIAAFMAFRVEIGGAEKLFWMIVLFAFLLMELSSIDHKDKLDEAARSAARLEEARAFSKIGQGIETAITKSDEQFKATVAQQSAQFDATMGRVQATTNEITGGDSYVLVYPDFTPTGKNTFPLIVRVCFKCQYGVPNAHIALRSYPPVGPETAIYIGDVDPSFVVTATGTISPSKVVESDYLITVLARNKPTIEKLKVRFNDQKQRWEFSWHIEREERSPHYNPKTKMAEGKVTRVLEDHHWVSSGATPVNPTTTTVIH